MTPEEIAKKLGHFESTKAADRARRSFTEETIKMAGDWLVEGTDMTAKGDSIMKRLEESFRQWNHTPPAPPRPHSPPKPKTTTGSAVLADGRCVEWELDEKGDLLGVTIQGMPLDDIALGKTPATSRQATGATETMSAREIKEYIKFRPERLAYHVAYTCEGKVWEEYVSFHGSQRDIDMLANTRSKALWKFSQDQPGNYRILEDLAGAREVQHRARARSNFQIHWSP